MVQEFNLPLPGGVVIGADANASYANQVTIGQSQWEFYLDFSFVAAEPGQAKPTTRFIQRIILSPNNVKGVKEALAESITRYEDTWGLELPDMRKRKPAAQAGTPGSQK